MAQAKHECYGCGEILPRSELKRRSLSRDSISFTRGKALGNVRAHRSERDVWMCAPCSTQHTGRKFIGAISYAIVMVLALGFMRMCAEATNGTSAGRAPEPVARSVAVEEAPQPSATFVQPLNTAPEPTVPSNLVPVSPGTGDATELDVLPAQ